MVDQKEKNNIHVKNGIIGFFDILGYSNILKENEPEDISMQIIPIFENIKDKSNNQVKDMIKNIKESADVNIFANKVIDSVEWLIFSDTILITLDISKDITYTEKFVSFTTFIAICSILQTNMFESGLPLRGVINYGKYFLHKNCFSGRPIVEAYDLCKRIDFAGCVFTDKCFDEIENVEKKIYKKGEYSFIKEMIFKYLVPLNNGEKKLNTLIGPIPYLGEEEIAYVVRECFWSYNKDIPNEASSKVFNTEKWIHFLKMKNKQFPNISESQ